MSNQRGKSPVIAGPAIASSSFAYQGIHLEPSFLLQVVLVPRTTYLDLDGAAFSSD